MSRYTVTWLKSAEDHLAEFWIRTPSLRRVISQAADEIDRLLSIEPESKGEVLGKNTRTLVQGPLRIAFTIRELDRLVEVGAVRLVLPYVDPD